MESSSPNIELLDDEIDHRQMNKKFVLVLLAIFVLFLIGIGLYTLGLFGEDKTEAKEAVLDMNVAKPKPTELEEKKFAIENHTKRITTEEAGETYTALTGVELKEKSGSNEDLTDDDFDEISKSKQIEPKRMTTRKTRENRKLQAQISLAEKENNSLMREDKALFLQTRQEASEARAEAKDRELNQRQADLVLSQLEKANANQGIQQNPFGEKQYENKKEQFKGERNIDNNGAKVPPPGVRGLAEGTLIAPVVFQNTTGKYWSKETGFYSLNSVNSKQSYSAKRGILAVVHGDAEGITISSEQEVKIRLLEPLRIFEGKESVTIPTGTLISAFVKIGADRLYLTINSIYFNEQMHEVNISIFDIDGRKGINVPSLLDAKNQNKMLANLAQPLSGGNFFVPSGSIANQVGSSIAMNIGQNAIQGASNYIRKKSKLTKVHIRSNYKIILFNQTNPSKIQQENEEIEQ
jgi:conjugative transposon TraM protein